MTTPEHRHDGVWAPEFDIECATCVFNAAEDVRITREMESKYGRADDAVSWKHYVERRRELAINRLVDSGMSREIAERLIDGTRRIPPTYFHKILPRSR